MRIIDTRPIWTSWPTFAPMPVMAWKPGQKDSPSATLSEAGATNLSASPHALDRKDSPSLSGRPGDCRRRRPALPSAQEDAPQRTLHPRRP